VPSRKKGVERVTRWTSDDFVQSLFTAFDDPQYIIKWENLSE